MQPLQAESMCIIVGPKAILHWRWSARSSLSALAFVTLPWQSEVGAGPAWASVQVLWACTKSPQKPHALGNCCSHLPCEISAVLFSLVSSLQTLGVFYICVINNLDSFCVLASLSEALGVPGSALAGMGSGAGPSAALGHKYPAFKCWDRNTFTQQLQAGLTMN